MRSLRKLSPKWVVSIKSGLRGPCGRGSRKSIEPEGMEDTRKTRPSKSTEQNSYELRDWSSKHKAERRLNQVLYIELLV